MLPTTLAVPNVPGGTHTLEKECLSKFLIGKVPRFLLRGTHRNYIEHTSFGPHSVVVVHVISYVLKTQYLGL